MSLLKKRLISAAIIISLTLTFVAMDAWMNFGCPGLWMLPVGIYLIWGSALECSTMLGRSFGKLTWPTMLGTTAVMIAASIPNSELVIFEESAHLPFVEEQERFTAVVRKFLGFEA